MDGRLIVGGQNVITRLQADGTVDYNIPVPTYLGDNINLQDALLTVDGKLVLTGAAALEGANGLQRLILRFDASGQLDPEFGTGGIATVPGLEIPMGEAALQLEGNGRVLLLLLRRDWQGATSLRPVHLFRIGPTGSIERTGETSLTDMSAFTSLRQYDGKILIVDSGLTQPSPAGYYRTLRIPSFTRDLKVDTLPQVLLARFY